MSTRLREPQDAATAIEGKSFRKALRSYGDELVLALGAPAVSPGVGELSEYMVFTRATPWFAEADGQLIGVHKQRLTDRLLTRLNDSLAGASVETVHLIEEVLGLSIEFSNGVRFSLWPSAETVGARKGEELWEISTPVGSSVVANSATGLDIVSDDAPFQVTDPDDVAAARAEMNVMSVIREAVRHLGFQFFEARRPDAPSIVDALVLIPTTGEVIHIEVKRRADHEHAKPSGAPRLVIYDPRDVPLLERDERAAVVQALSMTDATPDRIEEALQRLATAA
jgi:hypothetical protein